MDKQCTVKSEPKKKAKKAKKDDTEEEEFEQKKKLDDDEEDTGKEPEIVNLIDGHLDDDQPAEDKDKKPAGDHPPKLKFEHQMISKLLSKAFYAAAKALDVTISQ